MESRDGLDWGDSDDDDDDHFIYGRRDRLRRRGRRDFDDRRYDRDSSDDDLDLDHLLPRSNRSDRFRSRRRHGGFGRARRGNRVDDLDSGAADDKIGGAGGDRTIRRLHKRDRHGRPYIEEIIHEKAAKKEEKKEEKKEAPPPPPPAPKEAPPPPPPEPKEAKDGAKDAKKP